MLNYSLRGRAETPSPTTIEIDSLLGTALPTSNIGNSLSRDHRHLLYMGSFRIKALRVLTCVRRHLSLLLAYLRSDICVLSSLGRPFAKSSTPPF